MEKSTHGYASQSAKLLGRLKRIEGQVRGVHKMVEEGRYCVDILVQLAAIKSATHQVALSILDSHTRGCVKDALSANADSTEKIDELMEIIRQFTKA